MTRYLLDTSVLIDFSRRYDPVYSKLLALINDGNEFGVCAIQFTEFYAGVAPEHPRVWDEFMASLAYWPIERSAAMHAAQYRYEFARRGRTMSTTDALIAAVAWERVAVLITDNIKDFPMSDILLLPLRQSTSS